MKKLMTAAVSVMVLAAGLSPAAPAQAAASRPSECSLKAGTEPNGPPQFEAYGLLHCNPAYDGDVRLTVHVYEGVTVAYHRALHLASVDEEVDLAVYFTCQSGVVYHVVAKAQAASWTLKTTTSPEMYC